MAENYAVATDNVVEIVTGDVCQKLLVLEIHYSQGQRLLMLIQFFFVLVNSTDNGVYMQLV